MNKREPIDVITLLLPDEIVKWIGNAHVYESSGESGARTVYIDRDDGAYLKIASRGSLYSTAMMQTYFSKHKLSSSVIKYLSADKDYLITESLRGENGTSYRYIAEPDRLSEVFGQSLRLLHSVDTSKCPINDKMSSLLYMVEKTPFRQSHLNDISEFIGKASAEHAADEIKKSSALLKNDVLIHGDYCLPNIILNNWTFEGFIDVADGGLGDRHYDLAWGLWTLNRNLNTFKYGQRFLDSYGRDLIDKDRLRICGLLAALE
ncbi:MAG: ymdC [Herbinix sp.]|jgi:kanamycin kinase|nr:ymdC [Herbinix sp.]